MKFENNLGTGEKSSVDNSGRTGE